MIIRPPSQSIAISARYYRCSCFWEGASMKILVLPALLLVACLAAFDVEANDNKNDSNDRNGEWLLNGIHQLERYRGQVQDQTSSDVATAVTTLGYIRGVLDAQDALVVKTTLRAPIDARGKRRNFNSLSTAEKKAFAETDTFFAPLWNSTYVTEEHSAAQSIQIIKNYLEKHPERWKVDAAIVIEEALVESYGSKPPPSPSSSTRGGSHSTQ
jgi:hypothetical protein